MVLSVEYKKRKLLYTMEDAAVYFRYEGLIDEGATVFHEEVLVSLSQTLPLADRGALLQMEG